MRREHHRRDNNPRSSRSGDGELVVASRRKGAGAMYLKRAMMHPSQLLVLSATIMCTLITLKIAVIAVAVLVAELAYLSIIPHLRAFRRAVDLAEERAERAAAAEARLVLVMRMGDEHRRELERLEALVDTIRDTANTHGAGMYIAVDDCMELVARYVRLAIAHNTSKRCLASTDRQGLEHEIRSLEAAQLACAEPVRGLALRRLAIARMRAERWDRSRVDLEAMGHQLAIMGDLIRLIHQQCTAPLDPRGISEDIARLVADLEDNECTVQNLAEVCSIEETISPRLLEMGRQRGGTPNASLRQVVDTQGR